MLPGEENQSLKEFPLPVDPLVVGGGDEKLPTRIAEIEKEMKKIEATISMWDKKLADLRANKSVLLNHALTTGHTEDGEYHIIAESEYGNRCADPTLLKEKGKEKWDLYVQAIRDKAKQDATLVLQKAKENLEKAINLGIADKIFGKKVVDGCSTRPQTVTYKVVKK